MTPGNKAVCFISLWNTYKGQLSEVYCRSMGPCPSTWLRPFTGRTVPERTRAIVAGPLRPPSTLNAELAPEFEPIILKAMARNRDERYEHAAFMAQELRALNLRSFTATASHNPTSPSPTRQQGPREGIVIRPPKRPRVKSKRN